jgi:RsiW-degrading membrane proteinase PrsW (M82 family)
VVLAPVGHGLWTAVLGAVLFSCSHRRGFVVSGRLIAAYVGVSVLHALWDSMDSIAVVLTYVLTGLPWQYRLLDYGYIPEPTPEQARLFTVLNWAGLVAVSALGLLWLARLLRNTRHSHHPH